MYKGLLVLTQRGYLCYTSLDGFNEFINLKSTPEAGRAGMKWCSPWVWGGGRRGAHVARSLMKSWAGFTELYIYIHLYTRAGANTT